MSSVNDKFITVDNMKQLLGGYSDKVDERFAQATIYATDQEVQAVVEEAFTPSDISEEEVSGD